MKKLLLLTFIFSCSQANTIQSVGFDEKEKKQIVCGITNALSVYDSLEINIPEVIIEKVDFITLGCHQTMWGCYKEKYIEIIPRDEIGLCFQVTHEYLHALIDVNEGNPDPEHKKEIWKRL